MNICKISDGTGFALVILADRKPPTVGRPGTAPPDPEHPMPATLTLLAAWTITATVGYWTARLVYPATTTPTRLPCDDFDVPVSAV